MAQVPEPPRWVERWSRPRIAGVGAVCGIAVLVPIAVLPPVGDVVAVVAALAILAGAIGAWRRRAALEALPLVLGDVAVRQVADGRPSLRFRLWLGHGRAMRGIEASAVLRTVHGHEVPVPIDVPADHACGPVTLTAILPPLASGELSVRASVRSSGETWTAERSYAVDKAPLGPLDVPIRRGRSGVEWDRTAWDRPMSDR